MDDDAPSTPTGLTVGGVDPARGSAAAGGGPEMDRKDRVYKKGPWNVSEMLVLQSAKKEDVVRAGKGAPRDKHRTAQEKWQSIEDYCWAHFVQRSAQQCQDKWESMSAEFKKVKDCECGILSGQRSYWQMSMDERKAFRMPPNFQKEVYQGLQEWYDKNQAVEPGTISLSNVTKVEDSKVQSPVAVGSSSPSGGAVSSRKRPVERTVTRVPRKIVRSDSMSVPTHLDPRALSQGEREAFDMFDLGDFVLRKGATLRGAKVAYKVWGTLNEERSNAILYPSWFSGRHWENDWLIGPGMGLDPCKYFIIVPNMLGNGLSTSPSNCPAPYNKARFPKVTLEDNVRAQFKLLTEKFGIHQLKLVIGWSMAASQAFQWAASFPDMVERILPFCGSARISPHHIVFLEGVKAALTADSSFQDGWYEKTPSKGLRAVARVYAGWGFSQAFYWNEVWREMGYSSLEDFLIGFWEGFFLDRRDPNNLLNMLWTWQNSNIGLTDGCDGSVEKALGLIRAKAIVMPAAQDLYFPVADEEYEVKFMQNAELRVIPGVWGQFAGAGLNSHDTKFIDKAVHDLLAM
ncbi:hypothetical protein CY35_20G000500 [Sphagnum magellanicum]|nr:hypothetical protein CY35_20G000500 [Sphagnum magellanicum]